MQDVAVHLTSAETDWLAQCEATIERGMKTFREVGDALMSVRDNRLYRAEFATFEDYAEQRWGFTKTHANRLVSASSVAAILAPTGVEINSERQARELAPLLDEPDQLRQAFAEAAERTNGKPTAAAIRDVVRERLDPESVLAQTAMAALNKHAAIEEHNAWVREAKQDFTPERVAEIETFVRPAVQFERLVDACRQFLELLARVDFDAATQGFNPDKASPLREAVDRFPQLRRALEARA